MSDFAKIQELIETHNKRYDGVWFNVKIAEMGVLVRYRKIWNRNNFIQRSIHSDGSDKIEDLFRRLELILIEDIKNSVIAIAEKRRREAE